jgi:hypothetical protein
MLLLVLYTPRRIVKEILSMPSTFLGRLVKTELYTLTLSSSSYYSYIPY